MRTLRSLLALVTVFAGCCVPSRAWPLDVTATAPRTLAACPGGTAPVLLSVVDTPGDQGGSVDLCWQRACHDTAFTTLYRVLRHPLGSVDGWNEAATYDAIGLEMNCYSAPTELDSSSLGVADFEWRVVWDNQAGGLDTSNVLIGHSTDNILPGPVGNVTVEFHDGSSSVLRGGTSQLAAPFNAIRWTASPSSDVAAIRLYRASHGGFSPSLATFVTQLSSSALAYDDPAARPFYYQVVAVDQAGNASTAAGASPMAAIEQSLVYSADFEGGMPSGFTSPGATIQATQGWQPLGPTGNTFGGSFLRYYTLALYDTRLVVRNLPLHTRISLGFLLGLIDSWDGTELFRVSIDGVERFSHSFQLALGDTSSYLAPAGGLLSRGTNLGFSNGFYYMHDRAYDMSLEPAFRDLPHTADSVVVVWSVGAIAGPAVDQWQGGTDESWAIDNVRVTIGTPALDVPPGHDRTALVLAGAQPNPSQGGGLRVAFMLPAQGDATIELFDVAGRRIDSRDLRSLSSGRHVVELGTGTRLVAGVYMIRLMHAGQQRVTRALVVN